MIKAKLGFNEIERLEYGNLKKYNNCFKEELSSKLGLNNKDYTNFKDNSVNVLDNYAPKKTMFETTCI